MSKFLTQDWPDAMMKLGPPVNKYCLHPLYQDSKKKKIEGQQSNKIKGFMVSMSSIWLARVNIMFTQVELTNQSHSTSLNTPLSFEIMTKKERPTSIYHITVHHIVVRYFKNHRIAIIVGKENRSKPATNGQYSTF